MKMYPAEKMAEAIGMISDVKFSCVIFGSPEEVLMSNNLEQNLRRYDNVVTTINLAGKTNVRQLTECLRLCDVVLAETPLHFT